MILRQSCRECLGRSDYLHLAYLVSAVQGKVGMMHPMLKAIVQVVLCLLISAAAQKERKEPASEAELAGITARGRALAEYDTAAWHAADVFLAATSQKDHERAPSYVARKDGDRWEVVFGRLNPAGDKFIIGFEARQSDSPTSFVLKSYQPEKEASGFYVFAAKALAMAKGDFKPENRPYNRAVLPAEGGQFYVYIYPAQTDAAIWPLGGDVRYLISADGTTILEKHRMHNSIIDFNLKVPPEIKEVTADYHSAVLDEAPEDTDVFFAMSRKPSVNHTIVTKHFVYEILPDGKAVYLMTLKAYNKAYKKMLR